MLDESDVCDGRRMTELMSSDILTCHSDRAVLRVFQERCQSRRQIVETLDQPNEDPEERYSVVEGAEGWVYLRIISSPIAVSDKYRA